MLYLFVLKYVNINTFQCIYVCIFRCECVFTPTHEHTNTHIVCDIAADASINPSEPGPYLTMRPRHDATAMVTPPGIEHHLPKKTTILLRKKNTHTQTANFIKHSNKKKDRVSDLVSAIVLLLGIQIKRGSSYYINWAVKIPRRTCRAGENHDYHIFTIVFIREIRVKMHFIFLQD